MRLARFGFPPFSPSPRVCVIRCVLRSVCLCIVFFSPPPLECTIDHPRALRIADSAECCGLPVALSSRPAAAVSSQPDRQCCDTPSVSDSHGAHDSRKFRNIPQRRTGCALDPCGETLHSILQQTFTSTSGSDAGVRGRKSSTDRRTSTNSTTFRPTIDTTGVCCGRAVDRQKQNRTTEHRMLRHRGNIDRTAACRERPRLNTCAHTMYSLLHGRYLARLHVLLGSVLCGDSRLTGGMHRTGKGCVWHRRV
jgi:hypothetical protein